MLVLALVGVRVFAVGIALGGTSMRSPSAPFVGDVRRYHRIGSHPGTPYRDFPVEYPPLSLALIDAVGGSTVRDTAVPLMWLQLLLELGIAAIVAWGWGRRASI